jgi:formiminoglutamase
MSWLRLHRGDAPLIVSLPHAGLEIPDAILKRLVSARRSRKDTDWYIDRLYDFVDDLGATSIRTSISRTVIDVNRDATGASLYPGRATTELCPTTTFDGEPLYQSGMTPTASEIETRKQEFFLPYHEALRVEIERLRDRYPRIVVYDCHSIRSQIPRLFDGELPHFNIGTNAGASCAPALTAAVAAVVERTAWSSVVDGRFKGGSITRTFGRPAQQVHAIQMELACRTYLHEPTGSRLDEDLWPPAYDADFAAPMRATLITIIQACLAFAAG